MSSSAVINAHAGEKLRQRDAPQLLERGARPAQKRVHHPLVEVDPLPRPHQLVRIEIQAPLPQKTGERGRKGGLQVQQGAVEVEGNGMGGARVERGHRGLRRTSRQSDFGGWIISGTRTPSPGKAQSGSVNSPSPSGKGWGEGEILSFNGSARKDGTTYMC